MTLQTDLTILKISTRFCLLGCLPPEFRIFFLHTYRRYPLLRINLHFVFYTHSLIFSEVTLGSLTCEEGGNLSTRDLGFIYVSSTGRVGCEFIHPAQPTDVPSSRRSSRSHLYTPEFMFLLFAQPPSQRVCRG
jgi:hypothetical protein